MTVGGRERLRVAKPRPPDRRQPPTAPYRDLCRYLKAYHLRLAGATGASYDVELQAVWDDPRRRGGDLSVMVSGWESGQQGPGTIEDFIIAPRRNVRWRVNGHGRLSRL